MRFFKDENLVSEFSENGLENDGFERRQSQVSQELSEWQKNVVMNNSLAELSQGNLEFTAEPDQLPHHLTKTRGPGNPTDIQSIYLDEAESIAQSLAIKQNA